MSAGAAVLPRPLEDPHQRRYGAFMPICVACGALTPPPLCADCRNGLRPGGGLLVGSVAGHFALHHSGTGRRLVHQLKYHGVAGAADVLARLLAPMVPGHAAMIVPIPRATLRRMAFGVDPAWELARRIGAARRLPVVRALTPPLWWRRHASQGPGERAEPAFRARGLVRAAVLVDDVITSGATVRGAVEAFGAEGPGHIASVIAATSPGMMGQSKAPIASRRLGDGTAAWQSKVEQRPWDVL